jgi:hypothetical protein
MMRLIVTHCLPALLLGATACQFHARGPEDYEAETRALLETKNAELKSCYDQVLSQDKMAQGRVGVRFSVEPETGNIVNATVDPALTTAPEPLHQCVLNALNGLQLVPPDAREGQATFVFDFQAAGAAPAPAG